MYTQTDIISSLRGGLRKCTITMRSYEPNINFSVQYLAVGGFNSIDNKFLLFFEFKSSFPSVSELVHSAE